jgi:purine-cytosine permease-like protein
MPWSITLVILGFLMTAIALVFRDRFFGEKEQRWYNWNKREIWACVVLWILGSTIAALGWALLAHGGQGEACENVTEAGYADVLTVLSLLAAGAIAGWCAVEYQEFDPSETHLLNVIAGLFVAVFYVLFTAICYYLGKNPRTRDVQGIHWVIPLTMWLILLVFALIDIADYRPTDKKRRPRQEEVTKTPAA